MKVRKNLFLLVIFIAFLAMVLPMASIPVDIGQHSYTGGVYDPDTGEQLEAVTVELSGKRIYSLGRDHYDLEGDIAIESGSAQDTISLSMKISETLGGWTYGHRYGAFDYGWNGYDSIDLAYRDSYSALVLPLQKDGSTLYLSAVEADSAQTPQEALTDFLTAMGWT